MNSEPPHQWMVASTPRHHAVGCPPLHLLLLDKANPHSHHLGLDTGYAATTFPGITEAIEIYDNFTMAAEWVTKTSAGIRLAGNILKT